MKSRSPNTRIATSPYAAIARAGPLIAIAGTPRGRKGIDNFHGASCQMITSQRVYLVAQPERAGDVARQIGSAFGAETRSDHRRHAVAIGEREKSIPIDAARGQLAHRGAIR